MVHESFTSTSDTDINNTFHTRNTLEGKTKVWGGGSPIWDEVFYLCLALETDESALSPQIEECIVCVSTLGFITLHQA